MTVILRVQAEDPAADLEGRINPNYHSKNDMQNNQVHFTGVAGSGMSSLAVLLRHRGMSVTGSDRYYDSGGDSSVLQKLRLAGVELLPQDGSGIDASTAFAVMSSAVEADNPDRLAAHKHAIAIAGTSGKTTVTGMVGWILECAGRDPTVINGGEVLNWSTPNQLGSVRVGQNNCWVFEADESDRSVLNFHPEWAVINNISQDHFDMPETVALFQQFSSNVQHDIVCGAGVSELLHGSPNLIEATGGMSSVDGGWQITYRDEVFHVPLPGSHNAANALAATALCFRLGISAPIIRQALATFCGIHRRLEQIGVDDGVTVIDDFAHNPAKIRAAWSAVSNAKRVLGIWRPHGFAPLATMQTELANVFAEVMRRVDRLWVLPVYYAGGTATRTLTARDFVIQLKQSGINAEYASGFDTAISTMVAIAKPGDTIISMGARDPELPDFARSLELQLNERQQRGHEKQ